MKEKELVNKVKSLEEEVKLQEKIIRVLYNHISSRYSSPYEGICHYSKLKEFCEEYDMKAVAKLRNIM